MDVKMSQQLFFKHQQQLQACNMSMETENQWLLQVTTPQLTSKMILQQGGKNVSVQEPHVNAPEKKKTILFLLTRKVCGLHREHV